MKKEMYIILDKTEKNIRKPLVGVYSSLIKAEQELNKMRSRVQLTSQKLINLEKVMVDDFDSNKSTVFVITDKTKKENNFALFSEMTNATTALKKARSIVDNINAVTMSSERLS